MSDQEVTHYRVELKNGEVHYIRANVLTGGMTGDSIVLIIKGVGPVAYFSPQSIASILPVSGVPSWVLDHGEKGSEEPESDQPA